METGLVGWILATVAAAGLYGAVKNKPWLSVLMSAVNPQAKVPATIYDATKDFTGGVGGDWDTGAGSELSGSFGSASVIAFAKAQLGKPYSWGAAGPDRWDCSGLTMRAFDTVGIALPHNSQAQFLKTATKEIALTDHPPAGCLVFYGSPVIHHVGISLGDGTMISAPHAGDVVKISSIAGFGRDYSQVTNPLAGLPKVKAV
jgi:cell wall-associated NlpC family hydrolase